MTLWQRLFGRRQLDRELEVELRDHLERQVADYMREGSSETEARRRAAANFGGIQQVKEYCRDVRGTQWLDDLVTDVRYGLRMLAASRTFTLVAVLSLALGIGANTAIFTLVNSLLLRTLPVRAPEQLVLIVGDSWTNPIWEEIKSRQHQLFDGAAAWSQQRFDLSRGGQQQPVEGLWASGEFFDVYGVPAILGRTFTTENDRRGGGAEATVAVISYAFWQRQFGGAADVIGRTLTLNRIAFTVIGVTPPEFLGPVIGRSFDVAVPLRTAEIFEAGGDQRLTGRSFWWLDITARLKDGQAIDQATAALRAAQPAIREATTPTDWPEEHLKEYLREGLTLESAAQGPSHLRNRFEEPLVTIMVVVGLVLLIACANIANLMLARASGRRHELTMRLALGASRGRLARQLVTESLLLSAIGAALGLGFARWGSALLVSQFSTANDPLLLDLALDWPVLGFTALIAVVTALLFGVAPAMTTRRLAPMDALKEQGRGRVGGRSLASPIVVAQIALSLVLVVGAGLFVRTFLSLTSMDLGFDRDPILLVKLDAQRSQGGEERRADLYRRLSEAAARVPGVERAATSLLTPVSGQGWNNAFDIPGQPDLNFRERLAFLNAITPGWHSVYGTRLVAGREFTEADRDGAPRVAIVNEAYVKKFLRSGSALGQTVQQSDGFGGGPKPPPLQIVGVVEDAAYRSVRDPMPPTVYLPMGQSPMVFPAAAIGVRAAVASPASLVRPLTEVLAAVDPDVSLSFQPLSEQVSGRLARERVMAMLGGFFGTLALLLSAVGLYGVTAYAVNLRRGEIGVRMALGADVSRVLRLVLGRAARLVALGVVIGTGLSLWLAKFVSTLLFGLEARDAATLVGAVALMAVVGTLAAFLPALRAARIDPVDVLREG
jgi:putative ABC transport system permease protein